eukprot:TRINITY_DN36360_c0_g1_i1.p1 TRINITY_DN36360_c0_g1~~TRINITY_DN36360_c0_g1_i1.p1  ORF type:complete len:864 (-),score=125.59 TRINITY_DN36360_c0_g1_i1:31-2622(-)
MDLSLQVAPAVLLCDLGKLLRETDAFFDWEIAGHPVCTCLMRAALPRSVELHVLKTSLEMEAGAISQALVGLIHGQEVTVDTHDNFFALYTLVQKMNIESCKNLCKSIVSESKLESLPVKLKLPGAEGEAFLKSLQAERSSGSKDMDSKIKVPQGTDCEGTEQFRDIPTHRVLLAASSGYIRSLWSGAFKESATRHSFQVEASMSNMCHSVIALVDLIYGKPIKMSNMDDLLNMFHLADMWQCEAVLAVALAHIQKHLGQTKALQLLGERAPLPPALFDVILGTLRTNIPSTLTWHMALRIAEALPPKCQLGKLASRCLAPAFDDAVDLTNLDPKQMGLLLHRSSCLLQDMPSVKVVCRTPNCDIKVVELLDSNEVQVSRLDYGNNEHATIHVRGAVGRTTLDFSSFQTEQIHDFLDVDGKMQFSGRDLPPSQTLASDSLMVIKWQTDDSNTDKGWEFTVRSEKPVHPDVMTASLKNWAQQDVQSKEGTCNGLHAAIARLAAAYQQATTTEFDDTFQKMFKSVCLSLLGDRDAGAAVDVLNTTHQEGTERCAFQKYVLCPCAVEHTAAITARVVKSKAWLSIEPLAMQALLTQFVSSAGIKDVEAAHLVRWAKVAQASDVDAVILLGAIMPIEAPNTNARIAKLLTDAVDLTMSSNGDTKLFIGSLWNALFTTPCAEQVTGEAPAAKKARRSITAMSDRSFEILEKKILDLLTQSPGLLDFAGSTPWTNLQPRAFMKWLEGCISNMSIVDIESLVRQWVQCSQVPRVFEALHLASRHHDSVQHNLLHRVVQEHFAQAKAHEEIKQAAWRVQAAVEAQRTAESERDRLRAELAQLRRQRKEDAATMRGIVEKVYGHVDDDVSGA